MEELEKNSALFKTHKKVNGYLSVLSQVSQSRFHSLFLWPRELTSCLIDLLLGVARPAAVLRPARDLQGPPRPAARDERVQVRRGLLMRTSRYCVLLAHG